ncbi:rCG32221 [Rattus norvegicus]|uniref:RCG32221 n=1 Tax=Rattus norvegicus TaxID=10116 RepID=A6JWZ5_RAT|nr:rCG32221 [Rattus norvegicus]
MLGIQSPSLKCLLRDCLPHHYLSNKGQAMVSLTHPRAKEARCI